MDPASYLLTPASSTGALEWVFFIAQVLVALAGVYLAFLSADTHPVRGRALRQLGYALLAIGAVGAVVGGLRIAAVAPFTMPIWITVATLFNVVVVVAALYYATSIYPAQVAAQAQAARARSSRTSKPQVVAGSGAARQSARPVAQSTAAVDSESESINGPRNGAIRPAGAPGGRRESRRDRKRRNR